MYSPSNILYRCTELVYSKYPPHLLVATGVGLDDGHGGAGGVGGGPQIALAHPPPEGEQIGEVGDLYVDEVIININLLSGS